MYRINVEILTASGEQMDTSNAQRAHQPLPNSLYSVAFIPVHKYPHKSSHYIFIYSRKPKK